MVLTELVQMFLEQRLDPERLGIPRVLSWTLQHHFVYLRCINLCSQQLYNPDRRKNWTDVFRLCQHNFSCQIFSVSDITMSAAFLRGTPRHDVSIIFATSCPALAADAISSGFCCQLSIGVS